MVAISMTSRQVTSGGKFCSPASERSLTRALGAQILHLGVRRHERRTLRWREQDSNSQSLCFGVSLLAISTVLYYLDEFKFGCDFLHDLRYGGKQDGELKAMAGRNCGKVTVGI
jgi:hypothetical protein